MLQHGNSSFIRTHIFASLLTTRQTSTLCLQILLQTLVCIFTMSLLSNFFFNFTLFQFFIWILIKITPVHSPTQIFSYWFIQAPSLLCSRANISTLLKRVTDHPCIYSLISYKSQYSLLLQ